jgi:aspartyl-tRNA(Asn)/glutamyl-tRNA(Gln) amidotransferase subunit B
MNSLRSLGRAVEYEIERQASLLDAGERVVQETRHWNEDDGCTHSMRSKEEAFDYRYFPEPDLVPVAPDDEMRARAGSSVPELPAARRERLVGEWGISESDARVLLEVPGLGNYAEAAVAAGGDPVEVTKWSTGEVLAYLNENALSPEVLPLAPDGLAELVCLVADGTLSRGMAKDVLDVSLREGKRPKDVVGEQGLAQMSDEDALGRIVDEVLAAHATTVEEWRAGDDKVRNKKRGFLFGQVNKAVERKGNTAVINRLLDERLSS